MNKCLKTKKFSIKVMAIVFSLIGTLPACGETHDPLHSRKVMCNYYVNNGFLESDDASKCPENHTVFSKGAESYSKNVIRQLLNSAIKVTTESKVYDKSKHKLIPRDEDSMDFLYAENGGESKYAIPLVNISILNPVESTKKVSYPSSFWSISGESPRHDGWRFSFDILGVTPLALLNLHLCELVVDLCSAVVYTDAVQLGGLDKVVVMAMEFSLPGPEAAYKALYESEMTLWGQEDFSQNPN